MHEVEVGYKQYAEQIRYEFIGNTVGALSYIHKEAFALMHNYKGNDLVENRVAQLILDWFLIAGYHTKRLWGIKGKESFDIFVLVAEMIIWDLSCDMCGKKIEYLFMYNEYHDENMCGNCNYMYLE